MSVLRISKYSFPLMLLVFCLSCDTNSTDKPLSSSLGGDDYTLKIAGQKGFYLDSLTSYYSSCVRYFSISNYNGGKPVLAILNEEDQSLNLYDYQSAALITKMSLSDVSDKGFGRVSAFTAYEGDLYLLHRSSAIISIVGLEGNFVDYVDFGREGDAFPIDGFVGSTFNPIHVAGDTIHLTRFFHGSNEYQILSKTVDGSYHKFWYELPVDYRDEVWSPNQTVNYQDYDPENGEFFLAIPFCMIWSV